MTPSRIILRNCATAHLRCKAMHCVEHYLKHHQGMQTGIYHAVVYAAHENATFLVYRTKTAVIAAAT